LLYGRKKSGALLPCVTAPQIPLYPSTCRYVPSENDGSRKLADINVAALTNDWLIWDDPGDLQCISEV
jgi:hypothetical protein